MRRIRRHRDFFTRDGEWATTSATRAHRSRRLRGLGRRLTITFLAVTLLVAGTASCLFFLASRGRMISERSVSLLTQANMVASGVSAGGGDLAAVQALLRTRSREAGARLVLLDVNGRVVADSAAGGAYPSLIGELVTDDLVDVALGGGQETSLRYLEGVGHAMYGAVPVVRGGEITGVLLASRAADDMVAAVAGLTRQLAIYLGASLVAVALAAAALGHHLTAPLRKLTRAAERLGEGVLTERVNLERDDEIGRLGRTFDLMAGQLERVDSSRRRFIGDASHEMRTPLATIKILTESLLAEDTYEPGETRRALRSIEAGADRLAGLVDGMLVLTRLEHARAARSGDVLGAVDLAGLARQVAADFSPLARGMNVRLEISGHKSLVIEGDEDAIYRALSGVVDNGIRHTPEGGTVTITASRAGAWACLEVVDTGVGIAPGALPHIFERFYRPDTARSRSLGGFGLGLAIAQETAKLHGGRIEAASLPGVGSTFTFHLPVGRVETNM